MSEARGSVAAVLGSLLVGSLALLPADAGAERERPGSDGEARLLEVQQALDTYRLAVERRDPALYLKVRPGLSRTQVARLQSAFEYTRLQTVDLEIDRIEISGDRAEASGRRRQRFVSSDGQRLEWEAGFVVTLRRTEAGWIIETMR